MKIQTNGAYIEVRFEKKDFKEVMGRPPSEQMIEAFYGSFKHDEFHFDGDIKAWLFYSVTPNKAKLEAIKRVYQV